ncbi:hypothetical protein CPB85DRAFT_1218200 [Mucidula mucida]|nr:hypothetical protein CPB85DRAFT_1218200 [Mucidula mucida]
MSIYSLFFLSTPFPADTTWPDGVHSIFCTQHVDKYATANRRYSGPYTKLLTYCFGANSFEFTIAPETPFLDVFGSDNCYQDPKFYVFIIVYDHLHHPVMIVNIQDYGWVDRASLRVDADKQIRLWLEIMISDCPLPRLLGLSFLATSLRECDAESWDRKPEFIDDRTHRGLPGEFLEGAWDIDILSQEGFDKMKEIVGESAKGVAALKVSKDILTLCTISYGNISATEMIDFQRR